MLDLRQLDLNLLLAFEAIYQQRRVTRAAEAMCLPRALGKRRALQALARRA